MGKGGQFHKTDRLVVCLQSLSMLNANTATIVSHILCVHGVSALERASQLITLMTEQR